MQKYYLRIYQVFLVVLAVVTIVFSCVFIVKGDEIVTETITLDYFETSLNNYDPDKLKDFVANSENDILYKNLINNYSRYRADGIIIY